MSIGIQIEHVIARQRKETANIAINSVAQRGSGHAIMQQQGGLAPQTTQDTMKDGSGNTVAFSRLGDDLDFILS